MTVWGLKLKDLNERWTVGKKNPNQTSRITRILKDSRNQTEIWNERNPQIKHTTPLTSQIKAHLPPFLTYWCLISYEQVTGLLLIKIITIIIMGFYSPQSISAPPGRLRRSWERTALATPSLQSLPNGISVPNGPQSRVKHAQRGA